MTFVLLGRDFAAPAVIRFWVSERIRIGKNTPEDPQIKEALACAAVMETDRAIRNAKLIVANDLYTRRRTLGISKTKLCKESGVSFLMLTDIESGEVIPTPKVVRRLDAVLNKHAGVAKK